MTLIQTLEKKFAVQILLSLSQEPKKFCILEKELGINTSTLTDRLNLLERSLYISKESCHKDKRCYYYKLSKRGTTVAETITNLQNKLLSQ